MRHPSSGAPPWSAFTPAERRLIDRLRTPAQVQAYLNALRYNTEPDGDTLRSFREVVRHRTAHCFEAAMFACVALEQHGYPPLVLSFESIDHLDHVLFVYTPTAGGVRSLDRATPACTDAFRFFRPPARSRARTSTLTSTTQAASARSPSPTCAVSRDVTGGSRRGASGRPSSTCSTTRITSCRPRARGSIVSARATFNSAKRTG